MSEITKEVKIVDAQHPYLGLDSFEEKYKDFFFGREDEIHKLFRLVKNNIVTVFFGSSGLGKTSLLKAGLFPKLKRNYYFPVYLRIAFNDPDKTLMDQCKNEIFNQIHELDNEIKPIGKLTLWEYFHSMKMLGGVVMPVLVFDQFEEIFTIGKENVEQILEFITEITDLIENQVPVSVQKKYANSGIPYPIQHQKYRVIFSLREDYLPKLEIWNEQIPSLKRSRFPVLAMNREQALEAVLNPGKDIIDKAEANLILDNIVLAAYPEKTAIESDEIFEPFLLSLICEKINNQRFDKEGNIITDKITKDLIKNTSIKNIIKNHYLENTTSTEKIIIEDQLLTVDGYRHLQVLNDILEVGKITIGDIERLVDKRIIRKVTRNKIQYIELIHDVLIPAVKESRDHRKFLEREIENQLIKDEERKRQKQKYGWRLAIVGSITTAIALICFLVALRENKKVIRLKALNLAKISSLIVDEDPTVSLCLAKEAYTKNKKDSLVRNNLILMYQQGPFYDFKIKYPVKAKSVTLSKNGKYALVTLHNSIILLYDIIGRKQIEIPSTSLPVTYAQFSPEGKYIVLGNKNNTMEVWDFKRKSILTKIDSTPGILKYVAFSPDKKTILAVFTDGSAGIYDWESQNKIHYFDNTDNILIGEFTPDNMYILTCNSSRKLEVRNRSGENLHRDRKLFGNVQYMEFSHNGKAFITLTNRYLIQFWNYSDGNIKRKILPEELCKPIKIAHFTPDSRAIAYVPLFSKEVYLSFLETSNNISEPELNKETHYLNKSIILNNNQIKARAQHFKGHSSSIKSFEFSTDSIKTSAQIFKGHTAVITSFEFSADSNYILTSSEDRTARLWNMEGFEILCLKGHENELISACFIGKSKNILTTSLDNTSRFWNLERDGLWRCIQDKSLISQSENLQDTFNCDGPDFFVYLIEDNDTTHILLKGHRTRIRYAKFSPDKSKILTTGYDGIVRLWNNKGDSLLTFSRQNSKINFAEFSDNNSIIIRCDNDIEWKWPISADLIDKRIDNLMDSGYLILDEDIIDKYAVK